MVACKPLFMPGFLLNNCKSILIPRNLLVNHVQQESISRAIISQLKLPEQPKRPSPPFFKFMDIKRSEAIEKHGKMRSTDMVKILAQEWKKCDENLKKELQAAYDVEMVEFIKNMIKYEKNLLPEQKEAIKKLQDERRLKNIKKTEKKKIQSLNKPKKPRNRYLLFLEDQMKHKSPDVSFNEFQKSIAMKWKELSVEDKEKYDKKAKADFEQYNKDLNEWELSMIRAGNTDVIRVKNNLNLNKQTVKK